MTEITELLQAMFDSLRYPPHLHAILVHLPIAAAVLGALLGLGLLATRGRSAGVRWSCFAIYALGALAAAGSSFVGEQALAQVPSEVWNEQAMHFAQRHEQLGEYAWIPLAVTALLIGLSAVPATIVRMSSLVLAMFAAVFCLGWMTVTSHYGAMLVHEHGITSGPIPAHFAPAVPAAPPVPPVPPAPATPK